MTSAARDDASVRAQAVSPVVAIAGAIGVFGVIYGTAARPVLGAPLTIASSIVVFSGAAQFTMVGLLAAGASSLAVLWAVICLDLRHLVLGATVRPRLSDTPSGRRAGTAWFLIDETVGLALAGGTRTAAVLVRVGAVCYGAWVVGTALGVAGGAAFGLEALAAAVFPVLFVGLASIISGRSMATRTVLGGALTLALLLVWPGLGGLAPVAAAVAVGAPGRA